MDTHAVLVKARNILDRRGYNWWQYSDPDGCGCALCPEGAIDLARGSDTYDLHAPHAAKEAVKRFVPGAVDFRPTVALSMAVRRASDHDLGREFTKDEVLAFFDKAIEATAPEPDWSQLPSEAREGAVA